MLVCRWGGRRVSSPEDLRIDSNQYTCPSMAKPKGKNPDDFVWRSNSLQERRQMRKKRNKKKRRELVEKKEKERKKKFKQDWHKHMRRQSNTKNWLQNIWDSGNAQFNEKMTR